MSRRLTGAALAVLALSGCIDLGTNPNEVVAIEFGPLPFPAIVLGDTLRDSLGVAAPLKGKLLDGAGHVVTKPTLTFFSLDTLVAVSAAGVTVARQNQGTARMLASGGGLQSVMRNLDIVALPDSAFQDGTPDTLRLVIPDDPTVNISAELRLKIQSKSAGTGVKSWIVNFRLRYKGNDVAPTDTTLAFLTNESGRVSAVDTTDAGGTASRKIRFKVIPGQVPSLDSLIVTAEAQYKGAPLPGAPVRMVVRVKPK